MKAMKSAYLSEMFPAEGERKPNAVFQALLMIGSSVSWGMWLELQASSYIFQKLVEVENIQ